MSPEVLSPAPKAMHGRIDGPDERDRYERVEQEDHVQHSSLAIDGVAVREVGSDLKPSAQKGHGEDDIASWLANGWSVAL